jgi:hypothetical protein
MGGAGFVDREPQQFAGKVTDVLLAASVDSPGAADDEQS